MSRRILPLAVVASIVALVAGLYNSRAPQETTLAPPPPPRERTAEPAATEDYCPVPLRWRIARVDSQFGLSLSDANAAVEGSIALWEDALGSTLFIHDEQAGFPIAFVYDGRQATAQERTRLRAEFDERGDRIADERAELRSRTDEHVEAQTDHQRRLDEYNDLAAGHNAVVQRWNQVATIPEPVLRELRATEDDLTAREAQLVTQGSALEAAGQALAAEVERLRRAIAEHDEMADALERMFASEPILAGRYLQLRTQDGRPLPAREIQVFQFDDLTHLRLVLTHELGHALGLGHVDDTPSMMSAEHELAGAPTDANVQPSDLELLREVCPEL